MTEKLRLKSWLEPLLLGKDSALLLSETTAHSLKGELLAAMLPLLNGTRSEDEVADALSDRFDLAEIFFQIIQLKRKGLIEATPEKEPSSKRVFYERLGGNPGRLAGRIDIGVTALGADAGQTVAECLSRLCSFDVKRADWRSGPLDADFIWVVVTPDYLEPDLEKFNHMALDRGIRWLPFKPDGIEPWIGPLFEPRVSACMECLLHRLRGHRIPEMQRALEKGTPLRLAQGHSEASLESACGILGLELEKVLTESPHSFLQKGLVTINLQSLITRCHELIRRVYCPACGHKAEAELTALPEKIYTLSPQPKSAYKDGGERIRAAAETMKVFENRISAITGEVGALDTNENVPWFFGPSVISSWATLNGHKGTLGEARFKGVGTSAGKGRTEIQAKTSALGEALERYCSQHFGYEPSLRAAYNDIKANALHPLELNPFSESQYENRKEWATRAETGHVPEPFDENAAIDWTPVWSLTQKRWKWVPSAFIYYNYPRESGGQYCRGDSNGVAAGNCIEEAFMQGFFELVERDGVAIWWYNRLRRPALELKSFGSTFAMETLPGLSRHQYDLHVLDLTTDLGIPAFAAVALHTSDPEVEPLLGFGSHFDPRIALDRAISEMGQSWALMGFMSPNEINRKVTGRNLTAEPFLRPQQGAPLTPFSAFTNHGTDDFLKDVETTISILDNLGLEMLVADLTRPEVGLSVVRVMVPGLVHFWPRFGAGRLYRVPVTLGWVDTPRTEEELNPVPFYF